jgi:hypothetical protein
MASLTVPTYDDYLLMLYDDNNNGVIDGNLWKVGSEGYKLHYATNSKKDREKMLQQYNAYVNTWIAANNAAEVNRQNQEAFNTENQYAQQLASQQSEIARLNALATQLQLDIARNNNDTVILSEFSRQNPTVFESSSLIDNAITVGKENKWGNNTGVGEGGVGGQIPKIWLLIAAAIGLLFIFKR